MGKVGMGKFIFLKYICKNIKKKYIVLVFIGIVVINVGGSILYSFFKFFFYLLFFDDLNLSL